MQKQPYIEAQISIPLVWMKTLESALGVSIGSLKQSQITEIFQTSIAAVDYTNQDLLDEIRQDAKIIN